MTERQRFYVATMSRGPKMARAWFTISFRADTLQLAKDHAEALAVADKYEVGRVEFIGTQEPENTGKYIRKGQA